MSGALLLTAAASAIAPKPLPSKNAFDAAANASAAYSCLALSNPKAFSRSVIVTSGSSSLISTFSTSFSVVRSSTFDVGNPASTSAVVFKSSIPPVSISTTLASVIIVPASAVSGNRLTCGNSSYKGVSTNFGFLPVPIFIVGLKNGFTFVIPKSLGPLTLDLALCNI